MICIAYKLCECDMYYNLWIATKGCVIFARSIAWFVIDITVLNSFSIDQVIAVA